MRRLIKDSDDIYLSSLSSCHNIKLYVFNKRNEVNNTVYLRCVEIHNEQCVQITNNQVQVPVMPLFYLFVRTQNSYK